MRHNDIGVIVLTGFVLLMIAVVILTNLWNKRHKRISDAKHEARWAELDAESAERLERQERQEALVAEEELRLAKVQAQLNDMANRIWISIRKREGHEKMRRMPREARMKRRTIPGRKRWPVVAGIQARNAAEDREWKNLRQVQRRQVLRIGKFQLWKY